MVISLTATASNSFKLLQKVRGVSLSPFAQENFHFKEEEPDPQGHIGKQELSQEKVPTLSCLLTSPAHAVPKVTTAPSPLTSSSPCIQDASKSCPSLPQQGVLLYQAPAMSQGQGRFTPALPREASTGGKKTSGDLSLNNIFLKFPPRTH